MRQPHSSIQAQNIKLLSHTCGMRDTSTKQHAAMTDAHAIRFGVIADPQYADADAVGSRDYRASLGKLSSAIATFNDARLDFVVTLGDLIDRGWDSFDAALEPYQRLRPPHFFVLGNHDFDVAPTLIGAVPGRLGLSSRYYDFVLRDIRFIVLDQTEVSLFATLEGSVERASARSVLASLTDQGQPNAQPWNAGISETQLEWLDTRLAASARAQERVVVLAHYPLEPFSDHALWNADQLSARLQAAQTCILYLSGHYHLGDYAHHGATHFVTLEGMVETTDETAFAIVEIQRETIKITGYGRATSRTLSALAVRSFEA